MIRPNPTRHGTDCGHTPAVSQQHYSQPQSHCRELPVAHAQVQCRRELRLCQRRCSLNNFFLPGVDPSTAQRFDIRIDWNQSEKQHIFGRFSFDRLFNSTFNAFDNEWDLNYAQNITNGRNILIADDYTLNPTTVLQLRYSFTRHYENQGGDPQQVGTDITSLGFPASLAAEQNYKLLPFAIFTDYVSPGGSTSGVGGTANYNTFQYASENSDVNIALTKVARQAFHRHRLRMAEALPQCRPADCARRLLRFRLLSDRSANHRRPTASSSAAATSLLSSPGWVPFPAPNPTIIPTSPRISSPPRPTATSEPSSRTRGIPRGTSPLPRACAGISSADGPSGITASNTSIPNATNTRRRCLLYRRRSLRQRQATALRLTPILATSVRAWDSPGR